LKRLFSNIYSRGGIKEGENKSKKEKEAEKFSLFWGRLWVGPAINKVPIVPFQSKQIGTIRRSRHENILIFQVWQIALTEKFTFNYTPASQGQSFSFLIN
jgi:hypothetical protein